MENTTTLPSETACGTNKTPQAGSATVQDSESFRLAARAMLLMDQPAVDLCDVYISGKLQTASYIARSDVPALKTFVTDAQQDRIAYDTITTTLLECFDINAAPVRKHYVSIDDAISSIPALKMFVDNEMRKYMDIKYVIYLEEKKWSPATTEEANAILEELFAAGEKISRAEISYCSPSGIIMPSDPQAWFNKPELFIYISLTDESKALP